MKIKHWQGYGYVKAQKISEKSVELLDCGIPTGEKAKQIVIRVSGNHEYGLERNDDYDVYNWLLKRFKKEIADYCDMKLLKISTNDYYVKNEKEHIDEEICDYTITYA